MKIKTLVAVSLISAVLAGCGLIRRVRGPEYHVLDFGDDASICVVNISKHGPELGICCEPEEPAGLVAEEGDLLYIFFAFEDDDGGACYYRYDPRDGQRLNFSTDPEVPFKILLNGRLISLAIEDDPEFWTWIGSCEKQDLRGLRSIFFIDDLDGTTLPYLEKVAEIRPDIGLAFPYVDEGSVLSEIVALFTPSWLVFQGVPDVDEELLGKLNKLECLYTYSSEHSHYIEKLPRLEALILEIDDEDHDVRFERIPKLRSLTLLYSEDEDLSGLNDLTGLRNLFLLDCYVEDISPLANLPRLQAVGLASCGPIADFSVLKNLSHAKWISFPPEIGQKEFADCLSNNPELEVIELFGCHEIEDLSPLSDLDSLRVLNLYTEVGDLSPLYELKELELLTLYDLPVEEEQHEKLREALPNTQIVTGGYCLGSGWLLLALPAMLAAVAGMRLIRKRRGRCS